MSFLAEGYHFPLTGIGIVSVVFFRMYLVPCIIRVSILIHLVFYILRTYALWNKNRILLISMLSIFFMSSQLYSPYSSQC
jgi:hypothetical protein